MRKQGAKSSLPMVQDAENNLTIETKRNSYEELPKTRFSSNSKKSTKTKHREKRKTKPDHGCDKNFTNTINSTRSNCETDFKPNQKPWRRMQHTVQNKETSEDSSDSPGSTDNHHSSHKNLSKPKHMVIRSSSSGKSSSESSTTEMTEQLAPQPLPSSSTGFTAQSFYPPYWSYGYPGYSLPPQPFSLPIYPKQYQPNDLSRYNNPSNTMPQSVMSLKTARDSSKSNSVSHSNSDTSRETSSADKKIQGYSTFSTSSGTPSDSLIDNEVLDSIVGQYAKKIVPTHSSQVFSADDLDWLTISRNFPGKSADSLRKQWDAIYPNHKFARISGGVVLFCKQFSDPLGVNFNNISLTSSATNPPLQVTSSTSRSSFGVRGESTDETQNSITGKKRPRSKRTRKRPWTKEEEALVDSLQDQMGNRWTLIAEKMETGRSGTEVKNHWHNKKNREAVNTLRQQSESSIAP